MVYEARELARRLAGDDRPGRWIEVAVDGAGPGDAFRLFFADGVLRARWEEGEADALRFTGRAETTLVGEEVPLAVSFVAEGGSVIGVRLSTELPTPGVSASELAHRFGLCADALPGRLRITRIAVHQSDGLLACVGEGDGTRLTVLRREGRGELLVAVREDWRLVAAPCGLTGDELSELAGADPSGLVPVVEDGLAAGDWLLLPGGGSGAAVVVPVGRARGAAVRRRQAVANGGAATGWAAERIRHRSAAYAVAAGEGFVVFSPGWPAARRARFALGGRPHLAPLSATSFLPGLDDLAAGSVAVSYNAPPLQISGGLAVRAVSGDYSAAVGGVLLVDTGAVVGTAVAAAFIPSSGKRPAFFAFGSLGAERGIGPPPFQVRGVVAGMGWRSHLRLPETPAEVPGFPRSARRSSASRAACRHGQTRGSFQSRSRRQAVTPEQPTVSAGTSRHATPVRSTYMTPASAARSGTRSRPG